MSKKTKELKKSKGPSWQWWTKKYLKQQARDIVMERPRKLGISRTQIKLEIEIEKKRLVKKWTDEHKRSKLEIKWSQEAEARRLGRALENHVYHD